MYGLVRPNRIIVYECTCRALESIFYNQGMQEGQTKLQRRNNGDKDGADDSNGLGSV